MGRLVVDRLGEETYAFERWNGLVMNTAVVMCMVLFDVVALCCGRVGFFFWRWDGVVQVGSSWSGEGAPELAGGRYD